MLRLRQLGERKVQMRVTHHSMLHRRFVQMDLNFDEESLQIKRSLKLSNTAEIPLQTHHLEARALFLNKFKIFGWILNKRSAYRLWNDGNT